MRPPSELTSIHSKNGKFSLTSSTRHACPPFFCFFNCSFMSLWTSSFIAEMEIWYQAHPSSKRFKLREWKFLFKKYSTNHIWWNQRRMLLVIRWKKIQLSSDYCKSNRPCFVTAMLCCLYFRVRLVNAIAAIKFTLWYLFFFCDVHLFLFFFVPYITIIQFSTPNRCLVLHS